MKYYTRYAEVPLENFRDKEAAVRKNLAIWMAGEMIRDIYDKIPADYNSKNIIIRMIVATEEGGEDKQLSELTKEGGGK